MLLALQVIPWMVFWRTEEVHKNHLKIRPNLNCTCLCTGGGWMAETFVRAPVTLTLHLPAPALLASASWDTRVGSQADNNHFLTQCRYFLFTESWFAN